MILLDPENFTKACNQVIDKIREQQGIGTLSEKTIHAVLKHSYVPDISAHECNVGTYVADALTDDGIIEIQTRNFNTLRHKLDVFLPEFPVTIVYPVSHRKWLRWINKETGEISAPRKSPKVDEGYSIFKELYRIKKYLTHPNLHFRIVLMDVEEYRLLNGWSKDKKKGSTRNDGIPAALVKELCIDRIEDFIQFLPMSLPEPFTTEDYKKETKLSKAASTVALNILFSVGVVKRIGKKGNSFLYEVVQ